MKLSIFRFFRVLIGRPKTRVLAAEFGDRSFSLLDVGAGNHSPTNTKRLFPNCRYSGLDLVRDYNNSEADFAAMERFFELDLVKLDYRAIPDAAYDVILLAHVIEHLPNGEQVLAHLAPKLKPGGILYVECPHPRSLSLPSMAESLNFYDDPSHVRMYTMVELCNALRGAGLKPVRAGTCRNGWYLLFSPVLLLWRLLRRGRLIGPDFWDHLGFAQAVTARKPMASGE